MSDDGLAKRLYEAARGEAPCLGPWDELEPEEREVWLAEARAAREHYGLPEGAEQGCVGKVIEALGVAEEQLMMVSDETWPGSDKWEPRLSARDARKKALGALRALGAPVVGASDEG